MGARLDATPVPKSAASLRRVGDMWEVGYGGRTAYVRDVKELHDLAALLARPGVELTAIDLVVATGGQHRPDANGSTVLRSRHTATASLNLPTISPMRSGTTILDVPAERAMSASGSWPSCVARPTGRTARTLGVTTAERARKAVTARIRDAIRRIAEVMPDLGAHLDRSVRTGNTCRYDP